MSTEKIFLSRDKQPVATITKTKGNFKIEIHETGNHVLWLHKALTVLLQNGMKGTFVTKSYEYVYVDAVPKNENFFDELKKYFEIVNGYTVELEVAPQYPRLGHILQNHIPNDIHYGRKKGDTLRYKYANNGNTIVRIIKKSMMEIPNLDIHPNLVEPPDLFGDAELKQFVSVEQEKKKEGTLKVKTKDATTGDSLSKKHTKRFIGR